MVCCTASDEVLIFKVIDLKFISLEYVIIIAEHKIIGLLGDITLGSIGDWVPRIVQFLIDVIGVGSETPFGLIRPPVFSTYQTGHRGNTTVFEDI